MRDATILFDLPVDREIGNHYVAWQGGRFRGIEKAACSRSTDDGPGGVLVVTYYDSRNDGAAGEITDHFAVFCETGCVSAAG